MNNTLINHISEQLALEETLYKVIEEQLELIAETDYPDAKAILQKTHQLLEQSYSNLNSQLDKFEAAIKKEESSKPYLNGTTPPKTQVKATAKELPRQLLISKILRDDYSALNLITMGNTLLHTAALALEDEELATLALKHLSGLAPVVVRLGELLPEVVTRELKTEFQKIDANVAQLALNNSKLAWKKVSL